LFPFVVDGFQCMAQDSPDSSLCHASRRSPLLRHPVAGNDAVEQLTTVTSSPRWQERRLEPRVKLPDDGVFRARGTAMPSAPSQAAGRHA
jgi:hypothetical protein